MKTRWFVAVAVLILASPRMANACWDCGVSDLHIVGVAPDGRFVSYHQGGSTQADCEWSTVTIHHAETGAALVTIENQAEGCTWHVSKGKLALPKTDRPASVGPKALADRIAQRLGATPLRPSARRDLFTAHSVFDAAEGMAGETTIHLRWDGEPVGTQQIANYSLVATVAGVYEHPSSSGLFVRLGSHTRYSGSGGICDGLEHDWFIGNPEQTAHAQLLSARALAPTDPASAAKILRQRLAAAGKASDPLLKRRLARSEIAAKLRAGKRADQCQVRAVSLLGVGDDGRVGWARRTEQSSGACTTLEQLVVESASGEVIVSHERKLPAGCDPKAPPWPAERDAMVTQLIAEHHLTPAVRVPAHGALWSEPGNESITFYEEGAEIVRRNWRTSSAAGSYALDLLAHPATGKHFVQFRSTPPWRWSDRRVCEDDIDDVELVREDAVAERRAMLPLYQVHSGDNPGLIAALLPSLQRPNARHVFLERFDTRHVSCDKALVDLIVQTAAQKPLQKFSHDLCELVGDPGEASCDERAEKRLRRACHRQGD